MFSSCNRPEVIDNDDYSIPYKEEDIIGNDEKSVVIGAVEKALGNISRITYTQNEYAYDGLKTETNEIDNSAFFYQSGFVHTVEEKESHISVPSYNLDYSKTIKSSEDLFYDEESGYTVRYLTENKEQAYSYSQPFDDASDSIDAVYEEKLRNITYNLGEATAYSDKNGGYAFVKSTNDDYRKTVYLDADTTKEFVRNSKTQVVIKVDNNFHIVSMTSYLDCYANNGSLQAVGNIWFDKMTLLLKTRAEYTFSYGNRTSGDSIISSIKNKFDCLHFEGFGVEIKNASEQVNNNSALYSDLERDNSEVDKYKCLYKFTYLSGNNGVKISFKEVSAYSSLEFMGNKRMLTIDMGSFDIDYSSIKGASFSGGILTIPTYKSFLRISLEFEVVLAEAGTMVLTYMIVKVI